MSHEEKVPIVGAIYRHKPSRLRYRVDQVIDAQNCTGYEKGVGVQPFCIVVYTQLDNGEKFKTGTVCVRTYLDDFIQNFIKIG